MGEDMLLEKLKAELNNLDVTEVLDVGICNAYKFHIISTMPKDVTRVNFRFTDDWLRENYSLYSGNKAYPVPSPMGKDPCGYFWTYKKDKVYYENRIALFNAMKLNPDFKIKITKNEDYGEVVDITL